MTNTFTNDEDFICGETQDHKERIVYEDHEVIQIECTECGAEWIEDKNG